MSEPAKVALERLGRSYGEHGLAVVWTDRRDPDDEDSFKRVRGSWDQKKPEPANFLAGLFPGQFDKRNPAVVLGNSGLVGIDVDGPVGAARLAQVLPDGLPETVTALSGRDGGIHHWFRPPPTCSKHKIEFGKAGNIESSTNGYFIAPPAIHYNGREYQFAPGLALGDVPLAVLPQSAYDAIITAEEADNRSKSPRESKDVGEKIYEGQGRDNHLTSVAGAMRYRGMSADVILTALRAENDARCVPSLPEKDIERITWSICQDRKYAPQSADTVAETAATEPLLFTDLDSFADVEEKSAEALLGDDEDTVLPADGTMMLYGKGGAGKTTLETDLVFHLAAGESWLGIAVPRPCKVLVIENEGPRGKMRRKLRAKRAAWGGSPVGRRITILEAPWGQFSLANSAYRVELAKKIDEDGIDIVAAGPLGSLGMAGGGTPDDVRAFVAHLESLRASVKRPLALIIVHHANKLGTVSGAWEGVPDTLAFVREQGNGCTRLEWEKVRWGSSLHGKTWTLMWRDGAGFEREGKTEITDGEIHDLVVAFVRDNPGCSAKALESGVQARAGRVREIRDDLLETGAILNVGGGKGGTGGGGMKLHLAEAGAIVPTRTIGRDDRSSHTGEGGSESDRPVVPTKGTTDWDDRLAPVTRSSHDWDDRLSDVVIDDDSLAIYEEMAAA